MPINICMRTIEDLITTYFQMNLFLKRFVNILSVKLITTEFFSEGLQKKTPILSLLSLLFLTWKQDKIILSSEYIYVKVLDTRNIIPF